MLKTQPPAAVNHHQQLAEKAFSLLKQKSSLTPLTTYFTPESTLHTLLLLLPRSRSRWDHPSSLISFLRWARPHPFFTSTLPPQALSLHLLCHLRHFRLAQTLSLSLSRHFPTSAVFTSLTSTLQHLLPSSSSSSSSSAAFDLVIKSYSSRLLIKQSLSFLTLAESAAIPLKLLSYNSILDSMFRSPETDIRSIHQFFARISSSGLSPNVFTYNILIRGFSSRADLPSSDRIFHSMTLSGCSPNVVTYNTLIHAHCNSGDVDTALQMLVIMTDRDKIRPSLVTYNSLINGLCRLGRTKESEALLEEIKKEGLVPNLVTYNTLMNGYCRAGDIHRALVLCSEMQSQGVAPDVVTYTSLVNAMCKAGNLPRAMELVRKMRDRGLKLNEMTFTTLIDGFCKKGFLNDALSIMEEMKGRGILPSVVSYNALVNGYCMLGRMDVALEVVREMEERGLVPDVVTYSTVLNGYCRNGNMEEAFGLKEEMVKKCVFPDAITYSSLIRGLCEASRLDDACDLFREMIGLGLRPDELTYTVLIDGHCKQGDVKKALSLHDEMVKKGILPDVVTYSVLINGLSKIARTKEARRLLFRLYYEEPVPDKLTYDTLVDCCDKVELKSAVSLIKGFCIRGLMGEADRVFDSIVERTGEKPNEAAYNVIIHGHCRAGNVRKAFCLYKEMMERGMVPSAISTISLIRGLSDMGMNLELNQVVHKLLTSCSLTDAEASKVLVEVNHKDGNMEAVFDILTEMAKDGFLPNGG